MGRNYFNFERFTCCRLSNIKVYDIYQCTIGTVSWKLQNKSKSSDSNITDYECHLVKNCFWLKAFCILFIKNRSYTSTALNHTETEDLPGIVIIIDILQNVALSVCLNPFTALLIANQYVIMRAFGVLLIYCVLKKKILTRWIDFFYWFWRFTKFYLVISSSFINNTLQRDYV